MGAKLTYGTLTVTETPLEGLLKSDDNKKYCIVFDEYENSIIINALNDKRNALITERVVRTNNIRSRAAEIVNTDLIFA